MCVDVLGVFTVALWKSARSCTAAVPVRAPVRAHNTLVDANLGEGKLA